MKVCHSAISRVHPVPLPWLVAGEYKSKLEELIIIFKIPLVVFFSALRES